jgi:hypothetical protein
MTAQQFIAGETIRAMEALIHQAKKVPSDKLGWTPLEEGRSTLDQVAECAIIPGYMPVILCNFKGPEFNDETMKAFMEMKAKVDNLDKAEAMLRENTAKAVEAIQAVPDDKLEMEIPFFGPGKWKIASIMASHMWNMHYHTGQICYIQTLLGDHSMG